MPEAVRVRDGWLAGATRAPSPNCDARPPGTVVDLIVVHAISLPPGEFGGPWIRQFFTDGLDPDRHPYFREIAGLRVSAHFLIDRRGGLTQFVDVHDRAWHAGESSWDGRTACNDFALGIELEGCDERPFADAQYDALVTLVRELRERFPAIGPERIVGHADVSPGRKTDPGPCFDWLRFRASLAA